MNNIPRQTLIEIISRYGTAIVDEPRRVEGLLRDLCGEHKREINALMDAAREGVALKLRGTAGSGVPPAMVVATLTEHLLDNRPMSDEMARWAVESWAAALGLPLAKSSPPPKPTETPPPAEHAVPDWLSDLSPVEPPKPAEPPPPAEHAVPDWLSDLSPVEPPKPAETPRPAEHAVPNWLETLRPVEPPQPIHPVTQPDIVQPKTISINLSPGVEMIFLLVSAGKFTMGSDRAVDENAADNEYIPHNVLLNTYWIGKYPVTNLQYQNFLIATGHRNPGHWRLTTFPTGMGLHPVTNVSWDDATAFCQWASGLNRGLTVRLPTEAEWEKAARGTDWRIFPWGKAKPDATLCNYDGNVGRTTPVGRYSPKGDSPFGCADMAGNVWEWCSDWYEANYYHHSPAANPTGPNSGSYRVMRGGSWSYYQRSARCAYRAKKTPADYYDYLGFRAVAIDSSP